MPGQDWEQILTPERLVITTGPASTAVSTEQDLATAWPVPADFFQVGTCLRWTILFTISTAITTPGTITMKMRYGASSTTGVALATSAAYAPDPTAAATTVTDCITYWIVCRSTGTAGTVMCIGQWNGNDFDDASATTLKGNLDSTMIPASAPAVATIDTTVATNFLRPTCTFSVTTAAFLTQISILESLNKFGP